MEKKTQTLLIVLAVIVFLLLFIAPSLYAIISFTSSVSSPEQADGASVESL